MSYRTYKTYRSDKSNKTHKSLKPEFKKMKKRKIQFIALLLAGFCIGIISFFTVTEVFAQVRTAVTNGFGYAAGMGFGTRDLRTIIFTIVNVILGFLAIVAVLIIAYGGLVWMTSHGNEQQVEKAKKILINAVIGLVVVFLSYSIAFFVFNVLMRATGVVPGGGAIACTAGLDAPIPCPESPAGCSWNRFCKDTNPDFYGACEMDFADPGCIASCTAINLTPPPPADPQIRNKVIVAELNAEVDRGSVFAPGVNNFQVTRRVVRGDGLIGALGDVCATNQECLSDKCTGVACDGNFVQGNITYSPNGKFIRFAPVVPCGAEKCFSAFATYDVKLINGVGGIQCTSGSTLTCGDCVTTFTTGDAIDITSPTIMLEPANICEGAGGIPPNNILSAKVKDDSGVTQVDYSSTLGVIGFDAPIPNPGVEVLSQINWFPPVGTLPTNPTLLVTAVALDGDSHTASAQRNYTIYKNHCCNGILDGNEEGTDCGIL
ncbi:MAG: hypothetical protein US74_C0008G0031 [Parcubacteria group bacterium GW2011_GWA2_38_13]|nr:MAG: hypothetical protein US74_C0008G0031 [Parcubacteria group bacterium GW2011_GWA2_38_13]